MVGNPTQTETVSDSDLREALSGLETIEVDEFYEIRQTSARWLLASLLVVNSGGLVTTLSADGRLTHAFAVATFFFSGVASALLCALYIMFSVPRLTSAFDALKSYASNKDSELDATAIRDRVDGIFLSIVLLLPAFVLGFASIILFFAGSATFAANFEFSDGNNDRRCLAIQRDMLSARPRRSDSPDLFQALGCRPQGEGSVYAPAK